MPKITVQKDGTTVSEKRTVNFVAGTGITITPTDNPPNQPVDIQIDGHAKSHTHSGDGSGSVAHSATTGQTTDDHHAKSHAHDGADGSGTVDHGALSGLGDDDHTQYLKEEASGGLASEVPDHTHASGAEAGTVAHSVLTGVGANDHHAQTHATAHQSGGADDLTAYFARLGAANAFTTGGHTMTAESAGVIPLVIKGAASQSANLQEWQDSAGIVQGSLSPSGKFSLPTLGGSGGLAIGGTATLWESDNTSPGTLKTEAHFVIGANLDHDGSNVGFYGTAPIAKQTGVAVTAAAIHAALVNLGLIAA